MKTLYELSLLEAFEYVSFTRANSWGGEIFPYENYRVMVYDHEEQPANFHIISRAYSYDVAFLLDGTIYKIFDIGDCNTFDFGPLEAKVKKWLDLDAYQSNRIKNLQGKFTNKEWICYLWEMNNNNEVW